MKKGRNRMPDKYGAGRAKHIGIAFEARMKRSKKRRKGEKAGRKAARKGER